MIEIGNYFVEPCNQSIMPTVHTNARLKRYRCSAAGTRTEWLISKANTCTLHGYSFTPHFHRDTRGSRSDFSQDFHEVSYSA